MRNERNSLRQAAITAGILAALGVCTLGGDWPRAVSYTHLTLPTKA